MAARNLLLALAVVVLINPSLSLEWFDESDVQRLFEVDSVDKAPEHVVVYPQVVTEEGAFAVTGDALSSDTLRLTFQAFGEDFDLPLQRDDFGIAPDFEMRVISKEGTRKLPIRTDCLYSGKWNSDPASLVTAETSDGLHVMIYRKGGPIYVTPLKDHRASQRGLGLAHVAYKGPNAIHCATDNTIGPTILPSKPARKSLTSEPARTSSEKVLELAVFSDYEMYRKYGDETGPKTLRLYTQASGLLKLPSLSSGNLIVKLAFNKIITDPNELATSTDISASLAECINHVAANIEPPGQPNHFDNAAYITGFDIGGPLVGQGLAYISVCGRKQAASISEYMGPEGYAPLVAHEIAHNLGCLHDPVGPCREQAYIMTSGSKRSISEWSTCSKSYYNDFVGSARDADGVFCYDDGGL